MTLRRITTTLVAGTLLASAALAQEPESFKATGITNNMRIPAGKQLSFTINIKKWTPEEERMRLLNVLKTQGQDALKKELEKQEAGYLVPPAWAKWPSWKIDVAASIDLPDGGRLVRAFTERPIAMFEAYYNTRSTENEFGILEMKFDKDGKGVEGWIVPAGKADFDEKGQPRVTTPDFSTGPMKLVGISSFSKKK